METEIKSSNLCICTYDFLYFVEYKRTSFTETSFLMRSKTNPLTYIVWTKTVEILFKISSFEFSRR